MPNVNRCLIGSDGTAWINGKRLAELTKIELKVTGKFEDVEFCGDYATYSRYTGWSGDGSVTFRQVDSMVLSLLSDAYLTGVMPEIKIITKLTDQVTGQSERVSVEGVTITEFILAGFESKALVEKDLPLKFTGYKILEQIS